MIVIEPTSASSPTRLTVFESDTLDQDGNPYVISCGYSSDGKFGYFICNQRVSGALDTKCYEYINPVAFVQKTDDRMSYQHILQQLGEYLQQIEKQ